MSLVSKTTLTKPGAESLLYQFSNAVSSGAVSGEADELKAIVDKASTLFSKMEPGKEIPEERATEFKQLLKVHEAGSWELRYNVWDGIHKENDLGLDFNYQLTTPWESPIHFGCDSGDKCMVLIKKTALNDLVAYLTDQKQDYVKYSLEGRKLDSRDEFRSWDPKPL